MQLRSILCNHIQVKISISTQQCAICLRSVLHTDEIISAVCCTPRRSSMQCATHRGDFSKLGDLDSAVCCTQRRLSLQCVHTAEIVSTAIVIYIQLLSFTCSYFHLHEAIVIYMQLLSFTLQLLSFTCNYCHLHADIVIYMLPLSFTCSYCPFHAATVDLMQPHTSEDFNFYSAVCNLSSQCVAHR